MHDVITIYVYFSAMHVFDFQISLLPDADKL